MKPLTNKQSSNALGSRSPPQRNITTLKQFANDFDVGIMTPTKIEHVGLGKWSDLVDKLKIEK